MCDYGAVTVRLCATAIMILLGATPAAASDSCTISYRIEASERQRPTRKWQRHLLDRRRARFGRAFLFACSLEIELHT
jgi:hypothetical protein